MGDILGVQRGVGAEDVRLDEPALTGADERPDRNAGAADAGFSAADRGIAVHTGKALAEIARDDLQERGLFTGRHSRQESFGVGEQWHVRNATPAEAHCPLHRAGGQAARDAKRLRDKLSPKR